MGEDRWIYENLRPLLPEKGFYVDAGCLFPEQWSNTFFLRQMGWQGIVIDANPALAGQWGVDGLPELTVAVLSDVPEGKFRFHDNKPMSRFDPDGESVQCRRLDEILASVKTVDLLSIDIEGAEFDAMKGFDFSRLKPSIIVSEYSTLKLDGSGVGEDFRLSQLLEWWGYERRLQTRSNFVHVLKSACA